MIPPIRQSSVNKVAAISGAVLIVGHSNTVPELIARFGGKQPVVLTDQDYGTLFVVTPADGKRQREQDPSLAAELRLSGVLANAPAMADTPTDTPPDRLSLDPRSEHYDEALLSRGVGIKFNGQEKTSVIEYSISEGWIRVAAGRSLDRYGQPMTIKLKGKVEPYFENAGSGRADEGVASEG